MKKLLKAAIRNLTSLATECLRSGEPDLMAEIQQIIIRLLDIQEKDELTQTALETATFIGGLMYTPIQNVHFANVYGSIEAHLYADLIQQIISDSRAFDGMVRVEPYPFTDDSDFFGIYVDFFPLKPDYDQINCQLYINIELQRDHISRLKN